MLVKIAGTCKNDSIGCARNDKYTKPLIQQIMRGNIVPKATDKEIKLML